MACEFKCYKSSLARFFCSEYLLKKIGIASFGDNHTFATDSSKSTQDTLL